MHAWFREVLRAPTWLLTFACASAWLCGAWPARAGGSAENALVVIDPMRNDAKYIGNYYLFARDLPPGNALYVESNVANFQAFRDLNIEALLGKLAHSDIRDHIDYIAVAPTTFYIPAPGLVNAQGCTAVTRFSMSGIYYMTFVADQVLTATKNVSWSNRYSDEESDVILPFDSSISWKNGVPSTDSGSQYMFLAAQLGYTGVNGNTVEELIDMIDRSIAVDGTQPPGTFYFMETSDSVRSNPRDPYFDMAVASIEGFGGQAEHLLATLPTGQHDCLGIMTGFASPGIETTDMTVLPGAFCDHLTSYAATFDVSSQEKLTSWIRIGASGSWGSVEEPCAFPGKFPHARAHVFYYQGLCLAEAVYRSVEYTPFQLLFYGDPLTRPFAYLPEVSVAGLPANPVSGTIVLTPSATTTHPTANIESFDLMLDGVVIDSALPGDSFSLDTASISDGWHDVRVLAYDDSPARSVGRWVSSFTCDNRGRAASVAAPLTTGLLTTTFTFDLAATPDPDLVEIHLVQNGRILAATQSASATVTNHGLTMGAGPVRVQAEALYAGGELVRSAPLLLDITYDTGGQSGLPPLAYSYTRPLRRSDPLLLELPGTVGNTGVAMTFVIDSAPAQATMLYSNPARPYVLIRPDAQASGIDTLTYHVTSINGDTPVQTVTLLYDFCLPDLNHDGTVDLLDLSTLLANFGTTSGATLEQGDITGDGAVDLDDLSELLVQFGQSCG